MLALLAATVPVVELVMFDDRYTVNDQQDDLGVAVQHDLKNRYTIRSITLNHQHTNNWVRDFRKTSEVAYVGVTTSSGGHYTYQVSYQHGRTTLHPQSSGDRNAPSPTELHK